ncbi:hypothetical protein [Aquitalea sp. LB_tupeE]|uniref:hypothetical protein n=1 Tax=Aquitalea sp. LB_tupeE TaxID=2748078 RepID=UPI0015BCE861|nr:hypothetical protein [Aquitalea sp. LB_tupeE]NWK77660.1 hypothetical protein [Aquitalea sp. LB_tupeE]
MKKFARCTTVCLSLFALCGVLASSMASAEETQWQKDHPRRTEVNKRLNKQNQRIDHKLDDGHMSRAEAKKLHKEDQNIRQQERDMARLDHGHITKSEQKVLNQEENQVSKQIKNAN